MNEPVTIQTALAHHQAGRLQEAELQYRQLLSQNPNHPDVLYLLGMLAIDAGTLDVAQELLSRAIAINPANFQYQARLGNVLLLLNRPRQAISFLEAAVRLKPDFFDALCDLGNTLCKLREYDRAIPFLEAALRLDRNRAGIHNNLAISLHRVGRIRDAIQSFDQACALKPEIPEFHWGLARALILTGDMRRGWQEFESFLRIPGLNVFHNSPEPRWTGQSLKDKIILLYPEGGFGDALHFIRYAPMVANLGAKVLLECHPPLVSLLKSVKGISQVFPRGAAMRAFDYQVTLQSLPLAFDTTLETIPCDIPYVSPPAELVESWRRRLANDRQFKIGLCWAGSVHNEELRTRSLVEFAPLADVPGVSFYSLQRGAEANQPIPPGMDLKSPADPSGDFADTAALAVNLDLIISVDTSIAHLGGALGLLTWVAIPMYCDFRWMIDRTDSPWYPSMRLFRQTEPGNWRKPIRQMVGKLRELLSSTNR